MTQYLRKRFSVFPTDATIDPKRCGHHRALEAGQAPWVNAQGECVQCGERLEADSEAPAEPAAEPPTEPQAGSRLNSGRIALARNEEAMLALAAQPGDVLIRLDEAKMYALEGADARARESWVQLEGQDELDAAGFAVWLEGVEQEVAQLQRARAARGRRRTGAGLFAAWALVVGLLLAMEAAIKVAHRGHCHAHATTQECRWGR